VRVEKILLLESQYKEIPLNLKGDLRTAADLLSKEQGNPADTDRRSDHGPKNLLPADDARLRADADRIRQQRDQNEQCAGGNHEDAEYSVGHSCSIGVGVNGSRGCGGNPARRFT